MEYFLKRWNDTNYAVLRTNETFEQMHQLYKKKSTILQKVNNSFNNVLMPASFSSNVKLKILFLVFVCCNLVQEFLREKLTPN